MGVVTTKREGAGRVWGRSDRGTDDVHIDVVADSHIFDELSGDAVVLSAVREIWETPGDDVRRRSEAASIDCSRSRRSADKACGKHAICIRSSDHALGSRGGP